MFLTDARSTVQQQDVCNNERDRGVQNLQNFPVAKVLMGPYILWKISNSVRQIHTLHNT